MIYQVRSIKYKINYIGWELYVAIVTERQWACLKNEIGKCHEHTGCRDNDRSREYLTKWYIFWLHFDTYDALCVIDGRALTPCASDNGVSNPIECVSNDSYGSFRFRASISDALF